MPGFDGTGPQGRGAMTGGGRGLCGVRRSAGRSPRSASAAATTHGLSRGEKIGWIKEEVRAMRDGLASIEKRVEELQ